MGRSGTQHLAVGRVDVGRSGRSNQLGRNLLTRRDRHGSEIGIAHRAAGIAEGALDLRVDGGRRVRGDFRDSHGSREGRPLCAGVFREPGGDRPLTIAAGTMLQQLVLKNQVLLGSVNASIHHYKQAVEYLQTADETWPDDIQKVITEKIPYTQFREALFIHDPEEIKVVIDWS